MFILLFNVYIFVHTGHSDGRFDRLNEFKYCIESYSSIKFDKIILYIKLEDRYQYRKEEILDHIHRCYDIKKTTVVWDKMYYQNEWKPILNEITKDMDDDDLIWFFGNDDHAFIDSNTEHLYEGLEIMKKDKSAFKSMYTSHWPEILLLSGKNGTQERIGNFIKFRATILDHFQIYNVRLLKFLILQLYWENLSVNRLEALAFNADLFLGSVLAPNGIVPSMSERVRMCHSLYNIDKLQTIFIPMKELCRHFDGYDHVHIPIDSSSPFPALILPGEANNFNVDRELVKRKIRCPHSSIWTQGNTFIIPEEWEENILKLYNV
jgi:hypothetical protein